MAEIANLDPGAGGELQLTDALRAACASSRSTAWSVNSCPGGLDRFDTGNPLGWWEANVELGLRHPTLGGAMRAMVARRCSSARTAERGITPLGVKPPSRSTAKPVLVDLPLEWPRPPR